MKCCFNLSGCQTSVLGLEIINFAWEVSGDIRMKIPKGLEQFVFVFLKEFINNGRVIIIDQVQGNE